MWNPFRKKAVEAPAVEDPKEPIVSTLWVGLVGKDAYKLHAFGDKKTVWNDFIHWYHGRPQSTCFVFHHRQGSDLILRRKITGYSIRNAEETS